MPKLAVLGQPVAHSRSPAMHSAALAELGLAGEWSYEAIEVAPEAFDGLVTRLAADGFAGVNVTVPHKLAALAVADRATDRARAIGAANTLTFAEGGVEADNTDAIGLIEALPEPAVGKRALVLGAGGSARAAVWALREAGAEVSIWNRTPERADQLAEAFDVSVTSNEQRATSNFDLLINCTTLGLGQASERPPTSADLKPFPLDADAISERQIVVDLVYGPHDTALLALARERGARVVDGLEVLVRQGAASLRIWTGLDPPLDAMRKAARAL
ncbi:MAG: shikimate dehydrogenase [Solirubrobacterales bacterium]